jgi:hypothetical protein
MNSDTFSRIQNGTKRNNLLALTGLGTAETIFTMGTDTGSANAFVSAPLQTAIVGAASPLDPNANPAVTGGNLGRPGSGYRGSAPYFNSSSFDCIPFVVSLSGRFTSSTVDATTAHAITLYQNTTAALGGHAVVSGLSSVTLAAGNYSFLLQALLLWDSVSGTVTGESLYNVAGTYARGVIAPFAVASPAALLFVASAKFNTGAANTITPVEFSISQL